uniref:MPN domain-containing protein n=1 Tax=Biomphalaria glabrata TaxID=6526 RepID=A0A2C9LNH0_BIOGL
MADLTFIEDSAGLAAKECDDSAQKESLNEEEGEEEMEDSSPEEEEETLQKARQAITCRSVTLTTLMDDGIIQAGEGVLSIDYLGQRFEADLLANGKIKWPQGSQEEFNTPSAWALHCKRLVNPIKRSGCGWASVKYNNRKLDIWKSIWARKHRTANPLKIKSPHHQPSTSSSTHNLVAAATTPPQPDMASPAPPSSAPLDLQCVPSANKLVADKTLIKPGDVLALKNEDKMVAKEKQGKKHTISESPSKLYPLPRNLARPVGSHQEIPLNLTFDTPVIGKKELISPVARTKAKFGRQEDFCVSRDRKIVSYADLGTRGLDVYVENFLKIILNCSSYSKVKELNLKVLLTISSKVLLVNDTVKGCKTLTRAGDTVETMDATRQVYLKPPDFHCHLTKSEVVGYLGGRWDSHRQRGEYSQDCSIHNSYYVSLFRLWWDFHCHLTKSEVVGYLGGRWDSHRQHLSVEQVFPARCRLGDKDRALSVEEEIRRNMKIKNLMVVGWYHSHPYCPPDPSIRDIDCQMSYQLKMRGSGSMYLPCIGFILSPFEKLPPKPDSKIQAYWVMPNLEKNLTEFYSGALDKIHLKEHWGEAITYLDKVKASLRSKLPEDQLESGTFLDYVQQLLKDMR